jgi:hypothetical protein
VAIVAGVREGRTFTNACEEADVPPNTGRTWLRKGREGFSDEYADFAEAVELAQVEFATAAAEEPDPVDDALPAEDELIRRLDKLSRNGSVPATKALLDRRLKRDSDAESDKQMRLGEDRDPFDELDEPIDIRSARSRRKPPAGGAA